MGNAASVEAGLRQFGNLMEKAVVQAMKDVALELRRELASRTPILTGRASASWNAAVNEADTSYQGLGYLNPEGASSGGRVNIEGAQIGDSIHVSNSIPYIGVLEYGSATRAGRYFTDLAVQQVESRLPEIVQTAAKKVG